VKLLSLTGRFYLSVHVLILGRRENAIGIQALSASTSTVRTEVTPSPRFGSAFASVHSRRTEQIAVSDQGRALVIIYETAALSG
jgi:hypothetical protein